MKIYVVTKDDAEIVCASSDGHDWFPIVSTKRKNAEMGFNRLLKDKPITLQGHKIAIKEFTLTATLAEHEFK